MFYFKLCFYAFKDTNKFILGTLSVMVILLSACGGMALKPLAQFPMIALTVDTSLSPNQGSIGGTGETLRLVGRMVGDRNIPMDFVLSELIIGTDDQLKLDAFLVRWSGTVLQSTGKTGSLPKLHRVKLNPSAASINQLLQEIRSNASDVTGTFKFSSEDGAKLFAIALAEANKERFLVTPNWVSTFNAIGDGTTAEAPSGDSFFSSNAFNLPYMNRGSAQDIGVGAAWRILDRTGRFANKVKIMIMDGGFAPNSDFPAVRNVFGNWNEPNLGRCGDGSSCPWHATSVTEVAMGQVDNAFGVAGPAGPVGELVALPFESDFFSLLFTLERLVSATVFGNPKIINISGAFELGLDAEIAINAACLFLCPSVGQMASGITAAVASTDKLIFAAAGNEGKDVDSGGGIESGLYIPCELAGVICVGGMAHNATVRDPGSNFGSKTDNDSVDIYGPFWTWIGPDPDDRPNVARLKPGTSFASPFVAGVAALVWAARPSLSANEVWRILRDTAHVGGVGVPGHQRRVNAFGAVSAILSSSRPPTISLSGPTNGHLNRRVFFNAIVDDHFGSDSSSCPPSSCTLTWDPVPTTTSGNIAIFRFSDAGRRPITVTATDLTGRTASQSAIINIINSAPAVLISQPTPDTDVPQGVPVQLLGNATDLNEGPDPGPGTMNCIWTSSIASDRSFPVIGCNSRVTFDSTGRRVLTMRASDPEGLGSTRTVGITITPPPDNFPPDISLGSLPPINIQDGYNGDIALTVNGTATDREGDNPISFTWKATSFIPDSETVFSNSSTISGPNDNGNLNWKPNNSLEIMGDFGDFGNDCYNGQVVRLTLEATDSAGKKNTSSLPDIKIYRCILI
jgi:subtilisin family serine protease